MIAVLHAAGIFLFLLLVFRLAGNRSIAEITTFDFVLLLIISEATQQALTGQDYSLTQALTVIVTLVALDILLSLAKGKSRRLENFLEGRPVILVEDGKPLEERLRKERVDEQDILEAARELRGLERMDQVKYAVLERNGRISIIPY